MKISGSSELREYVLGNRRRVGWNVRFPVAGVDWNERDLGRAHLPALDGNGTRQFCGRSHPAAHEKNADFRRGLPFPRLRPGIGDAFRVHARHNAAEHPRSLASAEQLRFRYARDIEALQLRLVVGRDGAERLAKAADRGLADEMVDVRPLLFELRPRRLRVDVRWSRGSLRRSAGRFLLIGTGGLHRSGRWRALNRPRPIVLRTSIFVSENSIRFRELGGTNRRQLLELFPEVMNLIRMVPGNLLAKGALDVLDRRGRAELQQVVIIRQDASL